jgi:hypothetical protein
MANQGKRRKTMQRNPSMAGAKLLLAMVLASLFFAGTARAQGDLPVYTGQFTLSTQVHWGQNDLQPGSYTITIESSTLPVRGVIRSVETGVRRFHFL